MAYLFDTNAVSEVFKPRPNPDFLKWLRGVPREAQFTNTVVLGELYVAAYRSRAREKWLRRIWEQVIPRMTVLYFDPESAEEYGRIRAHLLDTGTLIGDSDIQIAATALHHGLTVVTANVRHFGRIPDLEIRTFRTGAD